MGVSKILSSHAKCVVVNRRTDMFLDPQTSLPLTPNIPVIRHIVIVLPSDFIQRAHVRPLERPDAHCIGRIHLQITKVCLVLGGSGWVGLVRVHTVQKALPELFVRVSTAYQGKETVESILSEHHMVADARLFRVYTFE